MNMISYCNEQGIIQFKWALNVQHKNQALKSPQITSLIPGTFLEFISWDKSPHTLIENVKHVVELGHMTVGDPGNTPSPKYYEITEESRLMWDE